MTERLQVSVGPEFFSWLSTRAKLNGRSLSREAAHLLIYARASLEGETPFDAETPEPPPAGAHRQALLGPR